MSPRRRKPSLQQFPMLVRRDVVVFPRVMGQVMVFRPIFQRAVDEAMAGDRQIVVVGRRNREERDFTPEDLYTVGTLATVNRVMRLPDGTASVVLEGFRRVSIESVMETDPFYRGSVLALEESSKETMEAEATRRAVLELLGEAIKTSHHLGEEDYIAALNAANSGEVADQVANSLQLPVEEAQEVLELLDPDARLEHVHRLLARELEVLRLQNRMQSAVQEEVEKTQREHILREHLRMIQDQLKDVDPTHKEANDLNTRIEQAGMPEAVKDKALEEMNRLSMIPSMSPESSVLRNYLDWMVSLPWNASTEDNLDTVHAAKVLDKNHYGLRNVKQRLLEFMAVRKLSAGKLRSPVLCLVGPPGVGKTSLGRSIAEALGRVFVRVSLGGVRDEAEVRGHRRTYVGALPGRIVQAMKTAGVVNPVFMLDELDKMGSDFRGDPSSALLEVLDPEQNHAFSDHYLEVPYDLSKVLFIATANVLDPVIPALRDRLEVLELPGYTEDEKIHIAKQFLAPKQSEENGLGDRRVPWSEEPLLHLIRGYTHEAGVRNLEREIGGVYRKVAKTVADGGHPPARRTPHKQTPGHGPR
ncbi:MAG: endopeptidase La [Chloroflexota bacterium]|nr:endopeptidase La [Chloroflexota bacterium]